MFGMRKTKPQDSWDDDARLLSETGSTDQGALSGFEGTALLLSVHAMTRCMQ